MGMGMVLIFGTHCIPMPGVVGTHRFKMARSYSFFCLNYILFYFNHNFFIVSHCDRINMAVWATCPSSLSLSSSPQVHALAQVVLTNNYFVLQVSLTLNTKVSTKSTLKMLTMFLQVLYHRQEESTSTQTDQRTSKREHACMHSSISSSNNNGGGRVAAPELGTRRPVRGKASKCECEPGEGW